MGCWALWDWALGGPVAEAPPHWCPRSRYTARLAPASHRPHKKTAAQILPPKSNCWGSSAPQNGDHLESRGSHRNRIHAWVIRKYPTLPWASPLTFHCDNHIFGCRASSIGGLTAVGACVLPGHKQQALHDVLLSRAHTAHGGRRDPVRHTAQRGLCSFQPCKAFRAAHTVQCWGVCRGECCWI